jgi:DNA primase
VFDNKRNKIFNYTSLIINWKKVQPSEEIKNKLDIVDFIKDYIPLQAAGMNFRARCPFHNEKSPSFMVSPDKQIWHCFGCGKGGDIFGFLMEIEGLEFVEALRILAPKAGVTLRRQNPKEASERMRLLDIMDISRRFYHKYLLESPAAQAARDYLSKRGLDKDTIEEWQIGVSPDTWDGLLKVLKKQGYNDQEILKTGMTIHNQQRNSFYDRFRGRIMFPINDANGNIVAFTARVSPEKEATEQMGKYINSPQTALYNKSKTIFALDKSKQAIKQNDKVIIVEGQMDAITAHQFGFHNVVASSGTALTEDQIEMLKRFTTNFSLAFDVDDAGHMAADRGIREALKQDINITVIEVPDGKDPDDCIRKDKSTWEQAVKNAKHMMAYYFDRTFASLDLSKIEGRRQAAAKLLPIISGIANKIEKSFWLKSLAESIGVDENVLYEALPVETRHGASLQQSRHSAPIQNNEQIQNKSVNNMKQSREEQLSEFFLALLMKFFDLSEYAIQSISIDYLKGEENIAIYKNLIFYYNSSNVKNSTGAVKAFDLNDFRIWLEKDSRAQREEGKQVKITVFDQLTVVNKLVLLGDNEYFELENDTAKAEMIRIVILLKKMFLSRKMKEVELAIADSEKNKNDKKGIELMEELKLLSDEFRDLAK